MWVNNDHSPSSHRGPISASNLSAVKHENTTWRNLNDKRNIGTRENISAQGVWMVKFVLLKGNFRHVF